MPIRPDDFVEVADRLQFGRSVGEKEERCTRTVAGRAYYAAYLSLRQAARKAVGDPRYNIGHQSLISHLDGYSGEVERAGVLLRELRYFRELSDYWLDETVDRTSVGLALNNAKGILRDEDKISSKLKVPELKRLHEPQTLPKR
jgi:hypothetical protein